MTFLRRSLPSAAAFIVACGTPSTAPIPMDAGGVTREFRGVWVATVRNIDWPSRTTLTPDEQRAELLDILDRAATQGYNAVVLQVRPAADAVYRSDLEPWSVLLTGQQGTDPGYDPLEFAVAEAHARGLELHAWINPFRAGNAADTLRLSASHVWNTRRDFTRVYGAQLWMDPGEPEARAHSLRVVTDIVRRYDIDAIHMDDYFYPYPVRDTTKPTGNLVFPDSASFALSGSALALNDWRRSNIDDFVRRMYQESHAIKPMVRVGISPFGIWRPGNPASVQGFDAYDQIYADAKKWLQEGWVDYLAPQLYWSIAAPQQSFPALYDWWLQQNTRGRHVWPGLATYRAGSTASNGFALTEIADQLRLIRQRSAPPGHIMYNGTTTLKRPQFVETITPLYVTRAIPPAFTWLDSEVPAAPTLSVTGRTLTLSAAETPRWWLVSARTDGGLFGRARSSSRLYFGTASTVSLDFEPELVTVSAIDGAGNASPEVRWTRP
jgi:uncharacterized lipoprotein YddW (UPF0748 family)